MYHTVVSREPSSSMLDISIGPYNPDEFKKFSDWAPVEPKEGMIAYGEDIINFMNRLKN